MKPYDPKDFASAPGKFQLFKTAIIAKQVLTHNQEYDAKLKPGTVVGITYRCTAYNPLYRRNEPVYTIAGVGDFYANVLSDFVL